MKKFIITLVLSMLLVTTFGSGSSINAASHGCRRNGTSKYADNFCLYSVTTSNKYTRMSDTFYFSHGGTLSGSTASSKTTTYTVSLSLGAEAFSVAKIEGTVGVQSSSTASINITSTWYIPAKKYAYIRAVFQRKKVYVKKYTYDGAYKDTSYSHPAFKSYTEAYIY